MGLRGNLPIFIQNFLSERTFQILLGTTCSNPFKQEEGVPQGAILSTTLFNVKLNGIAEELTDGVKCSLYVDDFVIFFRSSTLEAIERQIQININKIVNWTTKNGFTVSPNKTVAMHFCKCRRKTCREPELFINNNRIEVVKEHKFLGLIWDKNLNFKAHLKYLKSKCNKALNIIRVLSYSNWGSDSKILLKLFRSLVRSKIDYGSVVYSLGDAKALSSIDVIHRHGIRLCLGAFKTTRIESLYAEAFEPPLEFRREELAMRYALKIKSNPNNPAYESIFDREEYDNECLGASINRLFLEAGIDDSLILKSKIPNTPIWLSEPNKVSFELCKYDKSSTSNEIFKSSFYEILPQYSEYLHIYTDGSKHDEKSGYGLIYDNNLSASVKLKDHSSIFTAELEAIKRALRHIKISPRSNKKFVIFSDSKSALEVIDNQESNNPLVIELLDALQFLQSSGFEIKFCWVPSHVGITGNEKADKEAKNALDKDQTCNSKIPSTDFIPLVKSFIRSKWQNQWNITKDDRLGYIMPVIKPFHTNSLNRKDEIVIHRIRIGHTRLTQSYKMEDPFKVRPPCPFCNNDEIAVKHLLIDCQHFDNIRNNYYSVSNMKDLLENIPFHTLIKFLKESRLYQLI